MRLSRLILLLFLAAQLWDGVFTYAAVHAGGLSAEGNTLLVHWMALIGPAPTLLLAKVGAAAGGVLLYVQGVHYALAGLTMIYAVAAIGPWVAHFGQL
ncbi:MAG: hypothetical protein R2712_20870 [Vicinamibacterales bacterium]